MAIEQEQPLPRRKVFAKTVQGFAGAFSFRFSEGHSGLGRLGAASAAVAVVGISAETLELHRMNKNSKKKDSPE